VTGYPPREISQRRGQGGGSDPNWRWPSGTKGLERTEKDTLSAAMCHWRILELTNSLSLLEEGREIRHYGRSSRSERLCQRREVHQVAAPDAVRPPARPPSPADHRGHHHRRAIVQVRGKCNQTLGAMRHNHRMMAARDVLRDWAHQRHLGIACAL
jgi:hypothetical protein